MADGENVHIPPGVSGTPVNSGPENEVVDASTSAGQLVPPVPPSPQRSRSPSPSAGQTNTTEYKVATQSSRLAMLTNTEKRCSEQHYHSVEEVEGQVEALRDIWARFQDDHDQLGLACRSTFFNHDYVTTHVYERAHDVYHLALSALFRQKARIREEQARQALENAHINRERPAQHRSSLPPIKLPQFNGEFSAWAAFRDLFTSLVINQPQLSNVEKLHYLKTSIVGTAAQLISNVAMSNDSFDIPWGLITTRFDNKERLISSYVGKLFTTSQKVGRSSEDLHALISSTKEILDALKALDVPVDHWDYVVIHLVCQRLDANLREAWELHRESLQPPAQFNQLVEFIRTRARALEAVQSQKSQSQTSSTQPASTRSSSSTRSAHHASATLSQTTKYPCDLCKGSHYIVTCPSFRELSIPERHKIVTDKRLCFNCFGHHNLRSCVSTRTCVTCGAKHHTMIHQSSHSSASSQRAPSSTRPDQQASTSSQQ